MEGYKINIVEIYPDPLILIQSSNLNYLESKLNVHNLTNEYIIFKVFNNQRSLYSAKPSTSFIPPMETTSITIKRFKKEEKISEIEQGKDKFLLIFYIINKVINNNEEAKEAFRSKIYKEDSKQETMISIIIKEGENDDNYIEPEDINEGNDINTLENNYVKGIEKLRIESNKINNNIKELENILEMVKVQKELKNEKDKALTDNKKLNKSNVEGFANIVMIFILLLGLLVGANLAKGYNNIFKGKPTLNEEVMENKSENYINKKINEDIEIKDKEIKINQDNQDIKNETNNENENNILEKNETEQIKNKTNNIEVINELNEEKINKSDNKVINETNKEKINESDNKFINEKNEENKNINDKIVSIDKNEEKKEKIVKVISEKEEIKNNQKIESKNDDKQNSDFLSLSFLTGVYLCLLQLII